MSISQEQRTCRQWCWVLAGAMGVVVALLLMVIFSWGIVTGVFAGLVFAIILGALLNWFVCARITGEDMASYSAAPVAAAETAPAVGAALAADADAAPDSDAGDVSVEAVVDEAAEAVEETVESGEEETAESAEEITDEVAAVQSGTTLAGEDELAARKGAWSYEPAAEDESAVPVVSDQVAADLEAGRDVDLTDYDSDGLSEGTEEGTRPEALDGPRDGQADDLKQIKGVGPKLEELLHSMGFYHFDQMAAWTADEIAWVDANLTGFKGRVSRDNWVEQARLLAAGGETEFSKRVEEGDVYDT